MSSGNDSVRSRKEFHGSQPVLNKSAISTPFGRVLLFNSITVGIPLFFF